MERRAQKGGKKKSVMSAFHGVAATTWRSRIPATRGRSSCNSSSCRRRGRRTRENQPHCVDGGLRTVATAAKSEGYGAVTKERQSLRFKDSRTGLDVVLVGTMHYNPAVRNLYVIHPLSLSLSLFNECP